MLIRSAPASRHLLPLAALPPVLALSGVAGCGLPWVGRALLMLLCLLRLGLVLRKRFGSGPAASASSAICWVDVGEQRILRWSGRDQFGSIRLGPASRLAAWGVGLDARAGRWISLPASHLQEAERRRLARWLLHGRPPAACWQPHARACRSRQPRLWIRYNRVLPDAPTAPWPPS